MGPEQVYSLGLNSSHLLVPELNLRAANATGINISGAAFVSITGMSSKGTRWRTNQLVYVAEGLDQLILSKEDCEALGLIERNFPTIGSHGSAETYTHTLSGGLRGSTRMFMLLATSSLPKRSCRWRKTCSHRACQSWTVRAAANGGSCHHRHLNSRQEGHQTSKRG